MSPASWVAAQNLLTQAFGLLLFAIQAPLLGPRAFGLITLVMVFIGFCEFVLEVASTDALVSVRAIDDQHYSTMTTANAVFASVLGMAAFVFAGPISGIFHEPELERILHWMAVMPLVSALATAPNAASRRAMQFRPLAIRVLASTLAGGIVGVTLTVLGFGVWALVWQAIIQRVFNVTILWGLVDLPFRMGFSKPHFRELWKYAAPMMVAQTMTWSATQIPRFILGLYLGADELGLFSLATRICDIAVQTTISPVYAVARVSMRSFIDYRAGLEAAASRLMRQMSMLCFPLCIGGAAVMPVLFVVWLDARWAAGVVTAQLLLLGSLPYVTHYGLSAALLAMNKQSMIAVNSTVQTLATIAVVAIFAPLGLDTVAAAIALRPMATAVIPVGFARRHCGISANTVFRAQWPVLCCAMMMGAVVTALRLTLAPYLGKPALLVLLVLAGAASYAVAVRLMLPEAAASLVARLRRRAA